MTTRLEELKIELQELYTKRDNVRSEIFKNGSPTEMELREKMLRSSLNSIRDTEHKIRLLEKVNAPELIRSLEDRLFVLNQLRDPLEKELIDTTSIAMYDLKFDQIRNLRNLISSTNSELNELKRTFEPTA